MKEITTKKPILRPLTVECFYETFLLSKCSKTFEIKYNRCSGGYVKKNNWGYWTEKEENKDKYICNDCLVRLYQNKYFFWENIVNEKKRRLLRVYANNGLRTK